MVLQLVMADLVMKASKSWLYFRILQAPYSLTQFGWPMRTACTWHVIGSGCWVLCLWSSRVELISADVCLLWYNILRMSSCYRQTDRHTDTHTHTNTRTRTHTVMYHYLTTIYIYIYIYIYIFNIKQSCKQARTHAITHARTHTRTSSKHVICTCPIGRF